MATRKKTAAGRVKRTGGRPAAGAAVESPESAESGELPFESAIERLEAIVDRLEGGELPLEESLRVFEEGVSLSRRCAEQLDAAERRIEVLAREGGDWVARPLAGGEDDASADPETGDAGEWDARED